MSVLNTADRVYAGSALAGKVYAGASPVWPSIFKPSNLPGLGFWLDAAQIVLANGAAVTSWNDVSGKGHNAVSTGTPPVLRSTATNGHPAVEFTGSLTSATPMLIPGWGTALSGKTQYTLFVVATKRPVGGSVPVFLVGPYHSNAWKWLIEYDLNDGMFWGHGGYRRYNTQIHDNIPTLLTFHYQPADPHLYVNGTEITEYNVYAGDLLPTVPDVGSDIQFGSYDVSDSYGIDGYESEIIWYDHALPDPDRLQVEASLKTKWGL